MEPILAWGLDLIAAIQQVRGPVLDALFRALSSLGDEEFYLLLFPIFLWCVDFGLGARLGILALLSSYLNFALKDLFQQPRPYHLLPSVGLTTAEGYGLPSNHAQSAVVIWGALAAWVRRRWFWALAVALMALIGLSRIYLGVHFPTDVLAGWGIGALILALYVATQRNLSGWLAGLSLRWQMALALGVPLSLLLIHPVDDTAMVMGALAGAGVGLILTFRYLRFSPAGPWSQRVLRFLAGAAIMVLLYAGPKMLFPGDGSAFYLAFRTLRFALLGLWATLGAPWLFRVLRLLPEVGDRD